MFMKYAHHFHAYQPGDIVHVHDGDGSRPVEYEERRSPVAVKIRGEEVKGENWTRAMLYSYEHIADTLSRMKGVSVDIEPFTFLMLLRYHKRAFEDAVELLQRFDAVPTTPFHPIVPHLDEFEQGILAKVSFDFYAPPLIEDRNVIGYWLPEAVITRKSARIVESSTGKKLVFLLDERQLLYDLPQAKHSCNRYGDSFVFGREWRISDAFAFNTLDVPGLVSATLSYRDDYKEQLGGVPYLLFTASDLESLLGNPAQLDRFAGWMDGLEREGVERVSAMEFVRKKLSGGFKRLEGECSFGMGVKDYSSWSDYFDLSTDGKTSDARWLGYRRTDGRVFAREVKGRRVSQLWKAAFTRLFAELNRAVRLGVLKGLKELNADAEEFLVRYARVFFRDYYDYFGMETSLNYVLEPAAGNRDALRLGRVYYLMLLSNHSCPRFWENLDTRVAFGNVSVMAKALIELMEYFEGDELQSLFIESYLRLLNFDRLYHLWGLGTMPSMEGWETKEEAWLEALKSEVPTSGYNVVTRAALYVGERDLKGELRGLIGPYNFEWAVADTGHIPGEVHGEWENREWCEHRL